MPLKWIVQARRFIGWKLNVKIICQKMTWCWGDRKRWRALTFLVYKCLFKTSRFAACQVFCLFVYWLGVFLIPYRYFLMLHFYETQVSCLFTSLTNLQHKFNDCAVVYPALHVVSLLMMYSFRRLFPVSLRKGIFQSVSWQTGSVGILLRCGLFPNSF